MLFKGSRHHQRLRLMKVIETNEAGVFVDPEQNGIYYRLIRVKDADVVIAEVNGKFNRDIYIQETIELSDEAASKYEIDEIEVHEIRLLKINNICNTCIYIPSTVTNITIDDNCTKGKLGFMVSDDNDYFCSEGFCLYNKDKTELIRYYSEDHKVVELSSEVTTIRKGAFSNHFIKRLILPKSFEKVSFSDYNATNIQEAICNGHVTFVHGDNSGSTPHILKLYSHMSEITWKQYDLSGNKTLGRNRIIITRFPHIIPYEKELGKVSLHSVPSTREAINEQIDFKKLKICFVPDVENTHVDKMENETIIITQPQWLKDISECDYESYDGTHRIAMLSFDNLDNGFKVFETITQVQNLIAEAQY